MAESNNHSMSSEDELMALATEPTAYYEFQSELTDSDEDDHEPLGPVTTDIVTDVTIPPSETAMASPPSDQLENPGLPEEIVELAASALNGITNGTARKERPSGPKLVGIQVALPRIPPSQLEDFMYIEPEEEDLVLSRSRRKPHFNDDMDLDYTYQPVAQKRKRGLDNDAYDDEDASDDGYRPRPSRHNTFGNGSSRRSTRVSTRASSHANSDGDRDEQPPADASRALRPRAARVSQPRDDRDELQESDGDDSGFFLVQSDIVLSKRKKPRRLTSRAKAMASARSRAVQDDDFETRRSSRANKNTKIMTENYDENDDIYYVQESKAPAAPKISSVKEFFQPAPLPFKEAHRLVCDTCQTLDIAHKGPLVHCQGCSNSYHRSCLGPRSAREQLVTKVGADSFVLQCRFCLCNHQKKDPRAPSQDTCFGCRMKGPSCAAFSVKKTPKQEEKLRQENGGVDPVVEVDPKLINNENNVLFRCVRCRRAAHYEHLPHPNNSRDPALNDPLSLRRHRLEEYQVNWWCKDCMDTEEEKVDKLVAWRPIDRTNYIKGQGIEEYAEDEIEYLIKWQDKSYNHCVWMPGAWVHGVCAAAMRKSFIKRTYGEEADLDAVDDGGNDSLMRWTAEEAVHESWICPDIILDVQYAPRTRDAEQKYKSKSAAEKLEDDKARILHVIKIYVKFQGLGYEDAVWDTPPDAGSGAVWEGYLEAYHEYLIGKQFKADSWHNMRDRINYFRTLDFSSEIEVKKQPAGLKRGNLMGYQLEGLNWMLYNFRHERNVILADEMGLGKTVQVVALLSSFIQDNPKIWPFLVIVPNSTCPNWRREIKKWAPDLRVVAYYGGKVSQTLSYQYELFPNGSRDLKAHVVIMSYDSAKDPETKAKFGRIKWAGMVIDEAQALKNDENGLYKALSPMVVPFKLLLTGTPLQNNKRELFNLLQFINPALKAEALDEQFGEITKENLPKLHELIRPYFLRRTKAQVLTFLPPMAQIILPVSMTVLQEKFCKSIMERNPQLIRSMFTRDKMKSSDRGSLSNILMQLRKCLCHPFVYSRSIEERVEDAELAKRNLIAASSKLLLLEVMLPKLKERGHRVLIFSQFLEQLTILEDFLSLIDLKYERLDGSQSSMEKQRRIDAFNAPDSNVFAMLLSTRAGGVGINLATADTVIILDPDWNPHQDIQALSRAHRIGQQKKVLCFQIMTVDSAEEKILQIGRKKMALDHLLIESMDDKEGEAANDVESVLKHGAAALFGEGRKKDAIVYDSAAVDKLLDRSAEEETKMDGDKSAESAFALARVWAQDEEGLKDDVKPTEQDPSLNLGVWDKILKQREEEARLEAAREAEALGRGGRRRTAATYTNQKLDFGDAQEHHDSDQASVDGDFTGSEAESSDDEGKQVVNSNKNHRGSQARDSDTLRPDIDPVPDKSAKSNGSSKGSSKRQSSATQDGRGKTPTQAPATGTTKPQKQIKSQVGSISTASVLASNGTAFARTAANTRVPVVPGQVAVPRPRGRPPVAKQAKIQVQLPQHPPPVSQPPSRSQQFQPQPRAQIPPQPVQVPCIICGYTHPPVWLCPESYQEAAIRVALDKLKSWPNLTTEERYGRKLFLTARLKQLRESRAQAVNNGAAPNESQNNITAG
ncbi:chromodomain-helicase [Rhypophila decipiens]